MSRVCPVLLKKPLSGHNVSHANNKTLRRFLPNLHHVTFYSALLNRTVRLRLSTKGIKTIEKHGGIDGFLKVAPKRRLHGPLVALSKEVLQKSL